MSIAVLLLLGILVVDRRASHGISRLRDRLTRSPRSSGSEALLLAELAALGLSAGLGFAAAMEASANHLSDDAARRVRQFLRHPSGADAPDEAAALFALADRALVTGAPLLASIDGYATNLRRIERSAAIERARRLPVKLLFPLALLILPGFLLLTLGPALLAGLGRVGL